MPPWMWDNLNAEENDKITVERVCLPHATSCKLEIRETEINDLEKKKTALKSLLSTLYCLTIGDVITVTEENGETFKVNVVQTEPEKAVNITARDVDALVTQLRYCEPAIMEGSAPDSSSAKGKIYKQFTLHFIKLLISIKIKIIPRSTISLL